jgi:hypothetical protein
MSRSFVFCTGRIPNRRLRVGWFVGITQREKGKTSETVGIDGGGAMKTSTRYLCAVIGLMVLAVGLLPGGVQAQALPVVTPGEFTAATNATIPPYQFVDASGKLQGMRIEMGEEIAKRLGLKMTWINVGFETHIPGLQSGRWDASITGMFFTPERAAAAKRDAAAGLVWRGRSW